MSPNRTVEPGSGAM